MAAKKLKIMASNNAIIINICIIGGRYFGSEISILVRNDL